MSLKATVVGYLLKSVLLKATIAEIANTVISKDVIFEEFIPPNDFFRIYRCKKTDDPDNPGVFSGSYTEEYFTSSLCALSDVVFRSQGIVNSVDNLRNIIYLVGTRRVDEFDPVSDILNFGTSIVFADLPEDNSFGVNIGLNGNDVLVAAANLTENSIILTNPNADVLLRLEANAATINSLDISLKEHVETTEGSYSIERDVNGNVVEINQYLRSSSLVGGVRTVPFLVAVPDTNGLTVFFGAIGADGAISAPKYIDGSATTSSIDIDIFNGSVFGDDSTFVHINWKEVSI